LKLNFHKVSEVIWIFWNEDTINAEGKFFDFRRFKLVTSGIIGISADKLKERLREILQKVIKEFISEHERNANEQ
jgi:hypothetical protein